MKRWHTISALIAATAAVVSLTACGGSSKSSSSTSTSAPTTTAAKAKTHVILRTAQNAKLGKQIVVGSSGKTLYLYLPDGSSTVSKVPAAIKKYWPAQVIFYGPIGVGSGLVRAKLTVHKQPSRIAQVAYNGHLLYAYLGDKKPGDANGQGLGGVWFAVLPTGVKAA